MPPGASGGARRWIWRAALGCGIGGFIAAGLLATPHGTLAAACDIWIGGNGNFNTPASWSSGAVPTSADDSCITATTITNPPAQADVYSVALNGSFSVRSLTLGGPNGVQTLLIPASNAQLTLSAASTIGSNGVLTMGDSGTGFSALCCAGVNLTNLGNINTVTGGAPANRYVRVNVTNAASGTIVIGGFTVFDDLGGGATTTTNNGSIAITSGILGMGGTAPSTFVNSGGNVSDSGSFYISPGTFVQRAGTETGNPVLLANGSVLDDDLYAGAGNFQFRSGTQTLTGTGANPGVGAGQVLTIQSDNSQTTVAKNLTNAGTIILGQAALGTSSICCSGVTLTNTGHVNTVIGGGGNHYLRLNLTNASSGTVDIGGPTFQDAGGGGATTTMNNGTLILEKGQTLALSGGSSFTQGFGGTFATTIDASAPPAQTFGRLTGGGGLVSLDGLLKVTTVGSPWPGSSWPIISSANVSGRFASLDFGPLNYTIQYSATAVTLYGLAPCDYWIGGNGNFNTASNWSYGTVPTSADDVCIDRNTVTTPKAALDSYTVLVDSNATVNTLTLGAPRGNQTLQLAGNNTQFFLNKTSSIIAGGTLNVGDSNVANGYTWLGSGGSGAVLINDGRLNTVQGGGGIRFLRINLNNFTHGTMDIAANDTRQDMSTTTTNNATFTVEAGVTFAISNGGAFTNLQGNVINNGTFSQNGGTFTERAGSESGNPMLLQAGILDDDLSAGAAKFTISVPNGSPYNLTGTGTQPGIAAGQLITIAGNNTLVDLGASLTNAGTLVLGDAGTGWSWLRSTNTVLLTNAGRLNTVRGGGGTRYLRANVTNAGGTIDVAALDTRQDTGTTITNNGTFTVEAGAGFAISGSSFTNSGGTITNNGTFSQNGGTFTERAGSESGNPVLLQAGILDDDLSAGATKFTISVPNGSPYNLTGTGTQPGIAAGQLISIAGNNTLVDLGVSLTNAGTLVLGDAGTGWSWLRTTSSVVLTNTGRLNTVRGGGGTRYLRANVSNASAGTVDIGATTVQDVNGLTFTNNGTLAIEPGSTFYLSTGATFTQGGAGTLQTTIDANATKFGQLNGGVYAVTLGGTLRVTTIGTPAANSRWGVIVGAIGAGRFASFDRGGILYQTKYAPAGVTLVVQAIRPYHALPPARILDTRPASQVGPYSTPLGPLETRDVQVTGQGGVPSGASAVVINVTVTSTSGASFLTVFPTGVPAPLASNLNWTAGQTVPNLVQVALGTGGKVSIYNQVGTTDVIFDVAGYILPTVITQPDGLYHPVVPKRVLDTRDGTGGVPVAAVGPGGTVSVRVNGQAALPSTGVSAVVLNVTVDGPTIPSYLTVWPTGVQQPVASNLNFVAGQTIPNRVIVQVGNNGTPGWVSFFNAAGSVNVIADVGGWFTDSTPGGSGSTFTGLTPFRILDTRPFSQIGPFSTPFGPQQTRNVAVAGQGLVPGMNATPQPTAVVLNVTVTNATAPSFLTVWPSDAATQPTASDLNYLAGQTSPNLVVVRLGSDGSISVYNAAGSTDVVIDVVGYYSG